MSLILGASYKLRTDRQDTNPSSLQACWEPGACLHGTPQQPAVAMHMHQACTKASWRLLLYHIVNTRKAPNYNTTTDDTHRGGQAHTPLKQHGTAARQHIQAQTAHNQPALSGTWIHSPWCNANALKSPRALSPGPVCHNTHAPPAKQQDGKKQPHPAVKMHNTVQMEKIGNAHTQTHTHAHTICPNRVHHVSLQGKLLAACWGEVPSSWTGGQLWDRTHTARRAKLRYTHTHSNTVTSEQSATGNQKRRQGGPACTGRQQPPWR